MIKISVNGITGIGIEPNVKPSEVAEILASLPQTAKISFVDLATTSNVVGLIKQLETVGHILVSYIDHHADPKNRQEMANIFLLRKKFQQAKTAGRQEAPCCCQLVELRSLSEVSVVFFHSDIDGLLSFLQGIGITYFEMISDASIMDGGKRGKLSEKGQLLADSQYLGPYFSVNPEGYRNTLQRVFQVFANWAITGFQLSDEINSFHAKVAQAAFAACALAASLAQETNFLQPNVAFCDFREAIKAGKTIAFPVWKKQVFSHFGRNILLCNVALGYMGEQVFIEIPRDWEAKGVNLQDFLPSGIQARLKNRVQVPIARWSEFLKAWQKGFPALKKRHSL